MPSQMLVFDPLTTISSSCTRAKSEKKTSSYIAHGHLRKICLQSTFCTIARSLFYLHTFTMFGRQILAVVLLFATETISERIPIDATLTNTLIRYAWFASAAYSSRCKIPPFNTTIEKNFSDLITDTQVTLFRDDLRAEYILAFRGTSSPWDIVTDFRKSLVNCTHAFPSCTNCTVCHPHDTSSIQSCCSINTMPTVSSRISRTVCRRAR